MLAVIAGADTIALIGSILDRISEGGEEVMQDVQELSDLYLAALLYAVASNGDQHRSKGKTGVY